MRRVITALRGISAALISAAIATVGFLLFGAFLPIWAMMLVYGRQNVQDAPGHGGIVLMVTIPIAGVLAVFAFLILTPLVYRRISDHRG